MSYACTTHTSVRCMVDAYRQVASLLICYWTTKQYGVNVRFLLRRACNLCWCKMLMFCFCWKNKEVLFLKELVVKVLNLIVTFCKLWNDGVKNIRSERVQIMVQNRNSSTSLVYPYSRGVVVLACKTFVIIFWAIDCTMLYVSVWPGIRCCSTWKSTTVGVCSSSAHSSIKSCEEVHSCTVSHARWYKGHCIWTPN